MFSLQLEIEYLKMESLSLPQWPIIPALQRKHGEAHLQNREMSRSKTLNIFWKYICVFLKEQARVSYLWSFFSQTN